METNNKLYKVALLTIGILLGFSLIVISYLKLDKPIFFEHYYDLRSNIGHEEYEEIPFSIRYITNIDERSAVIDIEFPEYPQVIGQASEYDYMDSFNWGYDSNDTLGESYGRYSLRTVYCSIISPQDNSYGDMIINEALISFDDGSKELIDLGELHLHGYVSRTELLESNHSSASSDGTSESRYVISGKFTYDSLESPLLNQFSDQVTLDINGVEISQAKGLVLEDGEHMTIKSQLKNSDNLTEDYRLYDIQPKFTFIEENGDAQNVIIRNIYNMYNNDYNFINFIRYLREREVL